MEKIIKEIITYMRANKCLVSAGQIDFIRTIQFFYQHLCLVYNKVLRSSQCSKRQYPATKWHNAVFFWLVLYNNLNLGKKEFIAYICAL